MACPTAVGRIARLLSHHHCAGHWSNLLFGGFLLRESVYHRISFVGFFFSFFLCRWNIATPWPQLALVFNFQIYSNEFYERKCYGIPADFL